MNVIEYNGYRIAGLESGYALVKIMPKGSGDLPSPLQGYFTKVEIAKQHIDQYLSTLVTNQRKRKTHAKEESASSS